MSFKDFFLKPISTTNSINIINAKINYKYKIQEAYFVEWVKTIIIQNIFTKKLNTQVSKIRDKFIFFNIEDAKNYAYNVERPSIPTYHTNELWYDDAIIFPKGYSKIVKSISNNTTYCQNFKKLVRMENSKNNTFWKYHYEFIEKYCPDIYYEFWHGKFSSEKQQEAMKFYGDKPLSELSQVYTNHNIKNVLNAWNYNTSYSNVVETYVLTPLGTYESVIPQNAQLSNERNEIIDSELERIDNYRNFLLSMKK